MSQSLRNQNQRKRSFVSLPSQSRSFNILCVANTNDIEIPVSKLYFSCQHEVISSSCMHCPAYQVSLNPINHNG